ncbi:hypothetical protein AMECASPLE_021907 [Ameca splendens]|uniref:Uncharacterized protein n=1 Tax=Ameca splendens TaxID=208324 RepID=A0ABV0XSN3_9TELE
MCSLCANEIKRVNKRWHNHIPLHPSSFIEKYPSGPLRRGASLPRLSVTVGTAALRYRHRTLRDNIMSKRGGGILISWVGSSSKLGCLCSNSTLWLQEDPHMDASLSTGDISLHIQGEL